MNAIITNEPRTLSRQYFGKSSRFCLIEFLGRFGEIYWFVKDAEQCDKNGYSKTVFQAANKEQAIKHFGFDLTITGDIIRCATRKTAKMKALRRHVQDHNAAQEPA